jgi:hypothetical protein
MVLAPDRKGDLVVLVADKNMQVAIDSILKRSEAMQLRYFTSVIFPHPRHDPGCRLESDAFLAPFASSFDHALVVFDRDGCGLDLERVRLEEEVEHKLSQRGWEGRSAVVAIDPELESWVWSDSPHVEKVLGWHNQNPSLREWLDKQGHLPLKQPKPSDPKTAMLAAIRHVRKARSPVIFRLLAERVSFERCTDAAFSKLVSTLRTWFPLNSSRGLDKILG